MLLPEDVFYTIRDALTFYHTTRRLKSVVDATPGLSAAAADPRTNLTIFAPRDEAYLAPIFSVQAPPPVTALVIPGARFVPRGFTSGEPIKTLAGEYLNVEILVDPQTKEGSVLVVPEGGPNASAARVEQINVIAGQSVIHGIDKVPLSPQKERMQNSPAAPAAVAPSAIPKAAAAPSKAAPSNAAASSAVPSKVEPSKNAAVQQPEARMAAGNLGAQQQQRQSGQQPEAQAETAAAAKAVPAALPQQQVQGAQAAQGLQSKASVGTSAGAAAAVPALQPKAPSARPKEPNPFRESAMIQSSGDYALDENDRSGMNPAGRRLRAGRVR